LRWQFTDQILDFAAWQYLASLKLGTLEEYYLMKPWGEEARGPALLILESAVQAARWLTEASSNFEFTFDLSEVENFQAGPGLAPSEGLIWLIKVNFKNDWGIGFTAKSQRLSPGKDFKEGYLALKTAFSQSDRDSDCKLAGSLTKLNEYNVPQSRLTLWPEIAPGV
jgi:hypothetical protein